MGTKRRKRSNKWTSLKHCFFFLPSRIRFGSKARMKSMEKKKKEKTKKRGEATQRGKEHEGSLFEVQSFV